MSNVCINPCGSYNLIIHDDETVDDKHIMFESEENDLSERDDNHYCYCCLYTIGIIFVIIYFD